MSANCGGAASSETRWPGASPSLRAWGVLEYPAGAGVRALPC